jgi:kumamolisin
LKVLRQASRRRSAVAAAAAALLPAGALLASVVTAAPANAAPLKVTVPQGIGAAALGNARVFGNTAATTPETVSFVLRARNQRELAAMALDGRGGLSVQQFAQRFGQSPQVIARLQAYMKKYGITSTVYRDGLDVVAHGTAGQFDSALSVQQKNYYVPAVKSRGGKTAVPAQWVHGTMQDLRLPADSGGAVLSVLGLTNYSAFVTNLAHVPAKVDASVIRQRATYTGALTPEDFANNYGVSPLYAKGIKGQGSTLGIVTLAALSPSAPTYFWKNILGIPTKANRVTVVNIDGGPGAPNEQAGSGETDLDVEQSGAIAPQANIVVYQAPNTDSGLVDAFLSAASQNTVDTLSSSWGESETYFKANVATGQESTSYVASLDQAFEELDVQGQSSFVSSGDAGAYDASADLGTTNLSVDSPADSPYTTSAGGTTLGGTINFIAPSGATVNVPIKSQRAWGWDWLWPYYADFGASSEAAFAQTAVAGGGGGYSTIERTPSYQQRLTRNFSAVEYLTPSSYAAVDTLTLPTAWTFTSKPAVTTGHGTGRAEPDVSADADPFTGYLLYDPLATTPLSAGWGGTSFVAPQLNASTALIDQYTGHRVGFWNPRVYAFAKSAADPFTPLNTAGTGNDNLYYTGTPGGLYSPATGLGYPNIAELANRFASAG